MGNEMSCSDIKDMDIRDMDIKLRGLHSMDGEKNNDESNNCKKFWVDDSKRQFNTDYTADFVLAGLVRKEEEKVEASLEIFRKPLKLQANVEEIKFKNLYAKGDFLQCVKERRLFETLSWIDKSPFYINYTDVNNLYTC